MIKAGTSDIWFDTSSMDSLWCSSLLHCRWCCAGHLDCVCM